MRISDLSSDVCSSDLAAGLGDLALGIDAQKIAGMLGFPCPLERAKPIVADIVEDVELVVARCRILDDEAYEEGAQRRQVAVDPEVEIDVLELRSEEHTSELQSLMRLSYDVFCQKTT